MNNRHYPLDRLALSHKGNKHWPTGLESLFSERLDLYKLTTFFLNKSHSIHNWYPYLQGFSSDLVNLIIDHFKITETDVVLDPWCGVGTTNLTCKEKGISSLGVDISPLAVFISKTKLGGIPNIATIKKYLRVLNKGLEAETFSPAQQADLFHKFIPSYSFKSLFLLRDNIKRIRNKRLSNFFLLGLLSSLPKLTLLKKDGAHYRILDRPQSKDVFRVFSETVASMLTVQELFLPTPSHSDHQIDLGDSRNLDFIDSESIDFVITSPPYLNRDNYIAQNKLDLFFGGFIKTFKDYRNLTFSTIRSHVESKSTGEALGLHIPHLDSCLKHLESNAALLNNKKIVEMVEWYFDDMYLSFAEIARILKKGGRAAIVVGNSSWAGAVIEVDKLLSTIAGYHNLRTTDIWVTRYKLNSAQQIVKYGKQLIRESIVLMEK